MNTCCCPEVRSRDISTGCNADGFLRRLFLLQEQQNKENSWARGNSVSQTPVQFSLPLLRRQCSLRYVHKLLILFLLYWELKFTIIMAPYNSSSCWIVNICVAVYVGYTNASFYDSSINSFKKLTYLFWCSWRIFVKMKSVKLKFRAWVKYRSSICSSTVSFPPLACFSRAIRFIYLLPLECPPPRIAALCLQRTSKPNYQNMVRI
jgi:hypothetical protein